MQKFEAMYLVDRIQASARDWLERKIDSEYHDALRNRYAQEIADLVNNNDNMKCIGQLIGSQVYDPRDHDIPAVIPESSAPLVYIRED